MTTTLSSDFQIGTDIAMIQVPQKYTVPNNPPSVHNPPQSGDTSNINGTTKDSVTIYISAIHDFNNPLTISYFIQKIDNIIDPNLSPIDSTIVPADGAMLAIQIGTDTTNLINSTNTWDGTHLGWKGKIPSPDDVVGHYLTLTPNLNNALNTYTATNYQTLFINPKDTGGIIDPNHPPSYLVTLYAFDSITNTYSSCSFTLVVMPSIANYGLGILEKQYLQTTINNPSGSGIGDIIINVKSAVGFKVSDSVLIFKTDFSSYETNTVSSVNIGNNTLGVSSLSHIYPKGSFVINLNYATSPFTNTVSIPPGGSVDLGFGFYPLEPIYSIPENIIISINTFDSPIIDLYNSYISLDYITYTQFNGYSSGVIPAGINTRDNVTLFLIHLTLTNNPTTADPSKPPVDRHALLKITGTDTKGVTTTAYTVIEVVPS